MKKILLLLVALLPLIIYSQESKPKPWAWDVEGKELSSSPKESINHVFNRSFKNYKLKDTEISFKSKDGYEYVIIYQKFSYEPLFIVDFNTEKKMTDQQIKKIPEIMSEFKEKYKYADVNIDKNNMLEHDIKDAIKIGLTDMFFLQTLGKPDNSYISSNGYKSYMYEGSEKSMVLMFNNGVVVEYKIHGGL